MGQDLTAGEAWKATADLETAVATLLGRLLFAYSRLDMTIGLCLVWANGGHQLDELTPRVSFETFHRKLTALEDLVIQKFGNQPREQMAWSRWVEQAHVTRKLRNELTHGRWGVNPYTNEAINVIGMPTSPNQREVRYSLSALTDAVAEIDRLQTALGQLRERCPV